MILFSRKQTLLFVLSFLPFLSWAAIPEYKTDVVVLGGGVGGLTSAVYLARGGATPLVIEGKAPGGAIVQSKKVQNWPGDIEISGIELVDKIRIQAEKNGAILSQEEMVSIDLSARPFSILVQEIYNPSHQRKILADACIIAMGTQTKMLGVPGEKKYESRGVFTCAVCDGPLYKDKVVAVVGGGDAAVLEADYLCSIAKKVYLVVRGDSLRGIESSRREGLNKQANLEIIYQSQVEEILGSESAVEKILIENRAKEKKEIAVDAVFLAIGSTPNTSLLTGQVDLDAQGYIICKNHLETSVPGVFAAGDVIDPVFKQAISAGGEGAKAAIQAQTYLASYKRRQAPKPASVAQSQVIEIKNMKELQDVFSSTKLPILVDFYATWCSPCRSLSPRIEAWAKELEGKVVICKVNVDVATEVASNYHIQSMPTVLQLNAEGQEMSRRVGIAEITRLVNGLK